MTANGSPSFDLRAFLSSAPIRWLITGGAFLIAAIAIGTTIMVGNFRERAINSNERELENTVLVEPGPKRIAARQVDHEWQAARVKRKRRTLPIGERAADAAAPIDPAASFKGPAT